MVQHNISQRDGLISTYFQFPIKGLKLGRLFFVKLSLIGKSNSPRIFGTRAFIATVIQFM